MDKTSLPQVDFNATAGLPMWPEFIADLPPIIMEGPPAYWKPLQHSMKRRCHGHDYSAPGYYLITITTRDRSKWLLGRLSTAIVPHIELSPLGYEIKKAAIPRITYNFPQIEIWNRIVMPDHLHLILHVRERLSCHLGAVISQFKNECNDIFWAMHGKSSAGLFEDGYNDRISKNYEALKRMKAYVLDNPRRLAIKVQNPMLFSIVYGKTVAGRECQIYGNGYLLDNPDRMAVVVHRSDSYAAFAAKCKAWRACCERGGILIGTAIAERERQVMLKALSEGFSVIKLAYNGFRPMYKPSAAWIDACAEGRLLEISPWPYSYEHERPNRERCMALNAMAQAMERQP